jgi:hypothetical protein
MTGFLLLPVAEDRVLFLFPFVEDRFFIAPCCRGQGFYCSLLQRKGLIILVSVAVTCHEPGGRG